MRLHAHLMRNHNVESAVDNGRLYTVRIILGIVKSLCKTSFELRAREKTPILYYSRIMLEHTSPSKKYISENCFPPGGRMFAKITFTDRRPRTIFLLYETNGRGEEVRIVQLGNRTCSWTFRRFFFISRFCGTVVGSGDYVGLVSVVFH